MILLRFKEDTIVKQLDTALFPGLIMLCGIMERILDINEIWITSVQDGKHKSQSLHNAGRALDIRCKIYPPEKVQAIVEEFKAFYDAEYDLIWESQGKPWEHLHLEYDPGNQNH